MNEKKQLELYLHIPFCQEKCRYCDFLSAPAQEEVKESYIKALHEEIRQKSKAYEHYSVPSVFIGGGTPSVFDGAAIARLMESLYTFFSVEKNAEITIECNPGTLNREKAAHYRQAGVNRISLGLQSARDEELKLLGRIHTFEAFLKNYDAVRSAGFDNVNLDLMFGLPMQKRSHWEYTLKQAAALAPEHISAYSLIIEEGTPFFQQFEEDCLRRDRGEAPYYLPDEDTERGMYEYTKEFLKDQGYHHYEISNFAKPGRQSHHNRIYWQAEEYLGLGLGAHSFWNGERFHNPYGLEEYMQAGGIPERLEQDREKISEQDALAEFMFLGLRLTEGVAFAAFRERFGREMKDVYGSRIDKLTRQGLLAADGAGIRLTRRGIDVSNVVFGEFLL